MFCCRHFVIVSIVLAPGLLLAQDSGLVWENARPDVKYVGTEACIDCHQDQYGTYLQTTHSVATVQTDIADEADGTVFEHPLSVSRYEVETDSNGQMVHREVRLDADGDDFAVTQQPIAYTVGSGTHGKSYLYRTGPFLGQSPVTWYQDSKDWQMSPGFNRPDHSSFHRTVRTGCLFCHVGSIDRKQHNPYIFDIVETTIGCERCHGPGELHVKKYSENPDASGDDYTIVNPDRLSRERSEAICQQCHMQGVTETNPTGKDDWDFRPGLALSDFRIDYQFGAHDRMMIVGHVEQLHTSECYKQTETLSCTTCHDPHNPIAMEDRVGFHRSVCLQCHDDGSCGEPLPRRMEIADNSCYQCHMPKADTNVVHAAFHHHRIGVHRDNSRAEITRNQLVPLLNVSQLSERERRRCQALATVQLLRDDPGNAFYEQYATSAAETLIKLWQEGPLDAMAHSQLAFLALSQNQRAIAEDMANEALKKEARPTLARIYALSLLAQLAFQKGDKERAVELYRQVANLRRDARDTFFLGLCENNVGNVGGGIAALEKSLKIDPTQLGPHSALQAIYQATGRPEKAEVHAQAQAKITAVKQLIQQRAAANPESP